MNLRESLTDAVGEWREFDRTRPSLPGEHLVVAGLGVALVAAALRTDCRTTATLQAAAGGALLLRAAAGRDGIARLFTKHRSDLQALREDAEWLGQA